MNKSILEGDTDVLAAGELPVLRDGATTVGGFQNIIGYLHTVSDGQWNLDAALDPQQKADCTAYKPTLHTLSVSKGADCCLGSPPSFNLRDSHF